MSVGRNRLKVLTGILIGHCKLRRHLSRLGLVDSAIYVTATKPRNVDSRSKQDEAYKWTCLRNALYIVESFGISVSNGNRPTEFLCVGIA